MIEQPFDWWHSGVYWYCSLQPAPGYRVSGCGQSKEDAIRDAQREVLRWQGKQRLRAAHSATANGGK